MKKTIYLILIANLSISCSIELDRGDAEDKIEDFFDYPNVESKINYTYLREIEELKSFIHNKSKSYNQDFIVTVKNGIIT